MKSGTRGLGMALAITVASASTMSGCKFLGQAKKEAKEPESAGQAAAPADSGEKLGLRLVYSDKADPDLPDASLDLKAETGRQPDEKIVASESDELDFPTPIALPNEKRPQGRFLVWSEQWAGDRIRNVNLDQRIEEEDGRLVGPTERIDVHYDVSSRRWFVPLLALIRGERENEHPGKLHRLTFDLTLENGERKLIHVRLRFRAVRPKLSVGAVEVFNPLSFAVAHDTIHKIGTDGLLLRTTVIANPAARPITAWIMGGFEVKFTTYLGTHVFLSGPNPRTFPVVYKYSNSALKFIPSAVTRSSGNPEKILERNAGWVAVPLAANEQVKVSWVALPDQNEFCRLPANESKSLGNGATLSGFISMDGWTLTGKGNILVGSTEVWEDQSAVDSMDAPILGSFEIDSAQASGAGGPGVEPYGCQGWIKI